MSKELTMGIFSRIFKVGEAHANRAIDSLEKPEVMLNQAIRDQEKHLAEAKEKVQSVIATERQNKALLDKEVENQQLWENRAEQSLKAGKEDLAAQALARAEEHTKKAETLRPQWESQKSSCDSLKADIKRMQDELAELKRNKEIIVAQSKASEVKKDIYEAKAKIGKRHDTGSLIERMKAKAERSSYEADAAREMAETSSDKDSLESEFDKMDNAGPQSPSVQEKLAAMKTKLNKS